LKSKILEIKMGKLTKSKDDLLGYTERKENLKIRIEANKRFCSFSLEDWLENNIPFNQGNIVLDIGCGNGNLFPVYSTKLGTDGVIVGVDKSQELLREAIKEGTTPKMLLNLDINNSLPFIDKIFNYAISTFAIYYVDDSRAIINEIKRVLKLSGEVLLIGPTDNNAKELYEFNKKVFNIDRTDTATRRTNSLQREFLPAIKDIFGNVAVDIIPAKLVFPDKEKFIRYYMATLLFEESIKKSSFKPKADELISVDTDSLEFSKEMIVIRGKKNE